MKPQARVGELRRIVPLLPAPICVLDRNARYLAASPRYARLCGAGPDALAGRKMLDFCPPALVEKARRDFEVLDSGEDIADHRIVFRDRAYLVSVDPIYESNNRTVAAISVALTEAGSRTSSLQGNARDGFAQRGSPLGSRIPLCALIQTLAVAEHLNFSQAASALGTSQSSVSARVKALENELGILLFERNTRGVRLTEAGRQFVEQIAAGIDQLDHAVKIAGMAATGECGRLRIGVHGLIPGSFLDNLLLNYLPPIPPSCSR